jgi:hypothetical protein
MHPSTAADDPAASALPAAPVRAGWALFSKNAGQTMDYTILDDSIGSAMAERYIRLGLTAHTDDPAAGRPEALPWLSFVGTTEDPAAACCVMRVDWSDRRDGTGQPVTPTRLLLIPWPDASRTRTTFTDQARAMQLSWTDVNGVPAGADRDGVPITLQTDHAAVSLAAIDHAGAQWAAATAALLLDGRQVVIAIGRTPVPMGGRLRYMDADFALLPYAYRARLSAATWASYRVKHSIRLSFAERGVGGQTEVVTEQEPAPPQSPEAVEYLRILRGLRDKGIPWARIVEHLAQQNNPGRCRDASEAVDVLATLDIAASVYRDVVNGRGSAVRVQQVLATMGWEGFETSTMRTTIAAFLTEAALRGDGEAHAVLVAHWLTAPVIEQLTERIKAELAAGRIETLRVWFPLAHRHRASSSQALLVTVTGLVAAHPTPATVTGWLKLLAAPPAGTDFADPEIHRLFIGQPAAAATLLGAFPFDPTGMRSLNQLSDLWLSTMRSQPSWLNPVIAAVKGDPHYISAALVDAMARQWTGGVSYVLEVAMATGHLDTVLAPMFAPLAALMQSPEYGSTVRSALHRLVDSGAPLTPQSQAVVDELLLIGDGQAPFLTRTVGRPDDSYLATLRSGLTMTPIQPHRDRIMAGLLQILVADTGTAAGARRLVAVVNKAATPLLDQVAPYVNDYCIRHPDDVAGLNLGPQWQARLHGSIRLYQAFVDRCRTSATGDEIAADIIPLLPFIPPQRLINDLRTWLVPGREDATYRLFRCLRGAEDYRGPEFARDLQVALVENHFTGGQSYWNWLQDRAQGVPLELDQITRTVRQLHQHSDQGGWLKNIFRRRPGA